MLPSQLVTLSSFFLLSSYTGPHNLTLQQINTKPRHHFHSSSVALPLPSHNSHSVAHIMASSNPSCQVSANHMQTSNSAPCLPCSIRPTTPNIMPTTLAQLSSFMCLLVNHSRLPSQPPPTPNLCSFKKD